MELLLLLMYSLSCASALGCIIILGIFFRYHEIREKVYNKIIAHVALCDLMVAVGCFIGLPGDGSLACFIQSPLINIGQVGQIFWVTVLAYYLYSIISSTINSNHFADGLVSAKAVLICYGVPVFVSFIPLTTVPFGAIDGGWCYIREGSKHKWTLDLWYVVSIFFWLYGAVFLYILLFGYIYHKLSDMKAVTVSRAITKAVYRISWYPIVLMVNYTPLSIYLFWLTADPNANIGLLGLIGLIVQLLQGFIDAVVFLYTTPKALTLIHRDLMRLRTSMFGSSSNRRLLSDDRHRMISLSDVVRRALAGWSMDGDSEVNSTSSNRASSCAATATAIIPEDFST
jgi:hypothetical protein